MPEVALFASAFLAATILPFSSELAFVTALANGMNPMSALIAASCGNVLAISVNYAFGYFLGEKSHAKLHKSKSGRKALYMGHKYQYFALMLSPLPLIGDPLTLVAGVLKTNFWLFLAIAGTLRILRYLLLTLMV